MAEIFKKKPQVFGPDKFVMIFQHVCERAVLARLSTDEFRFNAVFLESDKQGLVLDNRLSHLDDVRRLKDLEIAIYFPFRKTLLKGTVRLVGLTTFKGIRALRFTYPEQLETDEKRDVRRIRHLPPEAEINFHSPDFRMFHARIQDASPSGFALSVQDVPATDADTFQKGARFDAEASLDVALKLSFKIEIRHVTSFNSKLLGASSWRLGVKIVKLEQEAQARLNNWLLMCNSRELESGEIEGRPVARIVPKSTPASNSILVIGPDSVDLDFWYQCLGRKYEVITSDDNVANIRDSLNTGPSLLLVFLDAEDPERASFMRKFCQSLGNRFPLMFFGKEPDEKKQSVLVGQVKNHGFLDISERKILLKFRQIDEVMAKLNE